jgi:hypothetical protein
VNLGEEFGFSKSEVTGIVQEVEEAIKQWPEIAKQSGVPKALSEKISKNFQMTIMDDRKGNLQKQ